MYDGWRPAYSERYYTVNADTVERLAQAGRPDQVYLAVNRYMWLDISDDFKALEEGLVFKTEQEALDRASSMIQDKTKKGA